MKSKKEIKLNKTISLTRENLDFVCDVASAQKLSFSDAINFLIAEKIRKKIELVICQNCGAKFSNFIGRCPNCEKNEM